MSVPKISRKRLNEQKAYEKEGYKALRPKTRISNLAVGARGGMGGIGAFNTKQIR